MPKQNQAEMQMSPDDLAELRASVATISTQDVMLGRVLNLLVLHLGHAHGLDLAVEDAKAKAAAEEAAKAEEEAAAAAAAATPVEPAAEGA